jgi:GNAT superfamily N-acetyltransferase
MTDIRPITLDEWPLLREVRLAALADAPQAFSKPLARAEALTDDDWRRFARDGAAGEVSRTYLAFAGEVPVGIAVGLPDAEDPSRAFLVSMWVAPAARGTHTAADLLAAVERWATGRGARTLVAGVTAGNARAVAFYRKRGYVDVACGDEGCSPHAAVSGCAVVLAKVLG